MQYDLNTNTAIHCSTSEEANNLAKYLDELGFRWVAVGDRLIRDMYFDNSPRGKYYFVEPGKRISHGDYYTWVRSGAGYSLIEARDLLEGWGDDSLLDTDEPFEFEQLFT